MLLYDREFILRQSDFDCNDNIKLSALLDLFQTVAADHAVELGLGFEDMKSKGLAWVIVKTKLDVLLPLHSSERIKIETLPHPKGLVDYTRDYFIYNQNGELAVKGSSQWVLIDFVERKITRTTVEFPGEFVDKFAYENRRFEKIAPFTCEQSTSYNVSVLDLDHNGHVNNIRYADMMLLVDGIAENKLVKTLSICFSNEAKLGDTVTLYSKKEGDVTTYSGYIGSVNCFTASVTR